jgi:tetratricopeptide (TPR) repeat protein
MLAEWFAVTQVTQTPELAGLLRVMTPGLKAALLVLLAHASDHIFQAVQLFSDIVAADTTRLAEAGVTAAPTASAGQWRLDGELGSLILQATWSADVLDRVEDQLTESLPRTRAALAETQVKMARADGDAAYLAGVLDNLGSRLGELGRYHEGLAVIEEAVGLWRTLADDNPAHQPDLARALGNLGICLAGLRRPLADNPAHQPSLARALGNLGRYLRDLGRYREAVAAAEESLGLWRTLADDNPADQPSLAGALGNLGICLAKLGHDQEALAATEEYVGLYRPLARDNLAHQPSLADALGNLGIHLAKLGHDQEALAAAEEAVGLWRALADDNPAHQPSLAGALGTLGIRLRGLGRYREALAAAEESLGLWRALARSYPDRYQETYNRQLAQLRRDLHLRGQEAASIWLHLGDDTSPDQD